MKKISDKELSEKLAKIVKELNLAIIEASQRKIEILYQIDRKTLTSKAPLFNIRLMREI